LRYSIIRNGYAYIRYLKEFAEFKRLMSGTPQRFLLTWEDRFPCLADRTLDTNFDSHYIFHTAWAARVLKEVSPEFHIDISSSLYFCSLVSAFIPVKFYDFRPAALPLSNLTTGQANLTSLPFPDQMIKSLSCMHVVEHIGLGRYGDPLDPDGDLKAMAELQRVLAIGGSLLFVVPVGRSRLMFNAHRIYSYAQVISSFPELKLKEFSLITDDPRGGLVYQATKEMADAQHYGCGCFWFTREK
jgi:hypothetical protein